MPRGNPQPQPIEINGKRLLCHHCNNDMFIIREAQLHTKIATFFKWEWTGKSGTCFVCTECKYIHWFLLE